MEVENDGGFYLLPTILAPVQLTTTEAGISQSILLLGQWATTSRIDRKGNEINFTFVKMYFSFKEHSTFIYFLLLTQKAHILSPKIAPNRVLLI